MNMGKRKPDTSGRLKKRHQEQLLEALALGGYVSMICQQLGIGRSTYYDWRDADPEFAKAADKATQEGTQYLEAQLAKRGVFGYEKPVIYQGKMMMQKDPETGEERPLTVTEFDTTAAIFILKARNPLRYRDNRYVEHGGQVAHSFLLQTIEKLRQSPQKRRKAILGALNGGGDENPN